MALTLTVTNNPGYLSVAAAGSATLDDMFDMINQVAVSVAQFGASKVLVDQTKIQEDFRFTDHFAIGERVVMVFHHMDKAASVVRPDRRTGTSEKVAQKQGVQLRVFTSKDEAVAWLLAD
jgi:hypothetical protein